MNIFFPCLSVSWWFYICRQIKCNQTSLLGNLLCCYNWAQNVFSPWPVLFRWFLYFVLFANVHYFHVKVFTTSKSKQFEAVEWFIIIFCVQESDDASDAPPLCTEPEAEILSEQSRLMTANLILLISLGLEFLVPTQTKNLVVLDVLFSYYFCSHVAKEINERCFYSHFINTFHIYGKTMVQNSGLWI